MNISILCLVYACILGLSEGVKTKRYKQGNSKVQQSFFGIGVNHRKTGRFTSQWHTRQGQFGGVWPTVFNVAAKAIITANATCGEGGREIFCRFSGGDSRSKCGYCDNFSVDPNKRHPIHHVIDDSDRWWQSPALFYGPANEYVTIILDLKHVYQITYVIIKAANAPRPACWILERSLDGNIFVPWQYFASSDRECRERYGMSSADTGNGKGRPLERYTTDTEVVCTTAFSRLTPLENGEIHVSLVNGRPGANETSPELLEFTKARYVRFRLQAMGGKIEYYSQHQNEMPTIQQPLSTSISRADHYNERHKRLYYAIKEINIGGQCVCNGHASSCKHNLKSGHLQCECMHHTCGPHCDICCPLYNQEPWRAGSARNARFCLPCNCHGHAKTCHYDENVNMNKLSLDIQGQYLGGGVCENCMDFTVGNNCENCLPGYYRPYNLRPDDPEPCFPCKCDTIGALGLCNVVNKSLICECKFGYAGHRCDTCAEGFKGYPNCEPCPCDNRGVVEKNDCESTCICKVHVHGKYCDQCKPGYFELKQENPEGCSECFCSGVTNLCQPSLLFPSYIDTLDNWLLTTLALKQYETPYVDDANHLLTVGGGQLDNINADAYYWLAPPAYLGNALRSYGAFLEAKVHWSVMRGDTSGQVIRIPDAVLIGGVDEMMRLGWGGSSYEGSNVTLSIPFTSNSWYHIPSNVTNLTTAISRPRRTESISITSQYHGNAVTRAQFLTVLTNIKVILIRAHFHTDQIEGSLERVRLGIGGWKPEEEGREEIYAQVEHCSCPSGYVGISCELCDYGYVRTSSKQTSANTLEQQYSAFKQTSYTKVHGQHLCVRCDCNGHSATCNADTNSCACEHNTIGDRCTRCAPGYYGNPLNGTPDDCQRCACPLLSDDNNFSSSCQVDDKQVGYVCTQCPKGYTGDHCEICDDDYYGEPFINGGNCQSCTCGGGPCDKVTGQCLDCKETTEGCNCNLKGAQIMICEPLTGQCTCKLHFTGLKCEFCESGYYETTHNCTPCECNPVGAHSDSCDINGQCLCHENVTGRRCDRCKDGHYGYSARGCRECDVCNVPGHICDKKSGRCICPPNTYGTKCEKCRELYHWENINEKTLGCTQCDCNYYGSLSMQCNPDTGLCTCHVGFSGAQCQDCAPGYYRPPLPALPLCKRCSCSALGTDPYRGNCTGNAVWAGGTGKQWCGCDQLTGKCPCKINVTGDRCNICKGGTFGLSLNNPDGCTTCFCFGRSSTCEESNLTWGQIRSAPRILTYKPHENIILLPTTVSKSYFEIPETSGDITLTDHLDSQFAIYWRLPLNFQTDLVLSYGGYFRFRVDTSIFKTLKANLNTTESQLSQRIKTNTRHIQAPVIIIDGNGIRLKYFHYNRQNPISEPQIYEIKLDGTQWQVDDLSNGVNLYVRERLMTVLQNVTGIWIRATSSDIFDQLSISDVTLDSALHLLDEPPPHALSIEKCICPSQYNGTSCQNPSNGYYRQRTSQPNDDFDVGAAVGAATRCKCNNRSESCDIETGKCENCRNNTSGKRCEICAEGYYGFPMYENGTCIACNCPEESRNFAIGCTQNPAVCACKEGYEGPTCEKCSPGYYGKPDLPGNKCKPCRCNIGGSVSMKCDKFGECACKKDMTGVKCNQCKMPRYTININVCEPCNECVQDLLDGMENLFFSISNVTTISLGPPWRLLEQLEYKFQIANTNFSTFMDFQAKSNEIFTKDISDNYSSDLKTLMNLIKDLRVKYTQNIKQTADLGKAVNILLDKLDHMEDLLVELTGNYKSVSTSHISTQEAVRRAETILKEIQHVSTYSKSKTKILLKKCRNIGMILNDLIRTRYYEPGAEMDKLRDFSGRLIYLDEIMNANEETACRYEKIYTNNAENLQQLQMKLDKIIHRHEINADTRRKIKKYFKGTEELIQNMSLNDDDFKELKGQIPKLQIALDRNDESDELELKVLKHVNDITRKIDDYRRLFNLNSEQLLVMEASRRYSDIVRNMEQAKIISSSANVYLNVVLHVPSDDDPIYEKSSIALGDSTRLEKRLKNIKDNIEKYIDIGMSALYPRLDDMRMRLWAQGVVNINDTRRIGAVRTSLETVVSEIQNIMRNVTKSSATSHEVYKQSRYIINDNDQNLENQYVKLLNLTSIDKINQITLQIRSVTKLLRSDLTKMDIVRKFEHHSSMVKPSLNLNEMLQRLKYNISSAMKRLSNIKIPITGPTCTRWYRIAHHEPSMTSTISLLIYLPKTTTTSNLVTTLFYVAADDQKQYIQIDLFSNRTVQCRLRMGRSNDKHATVSANVSAEGYWNIKLERQYQDVKLTTFNSAVNKTFTQSIKLNDEICEIFDVYSTNHVILGGHGLNETGLLGCLQNAIYNGRNIGLWTFINSTDCYTCKRSTNVINNRMMFNGNGYSQFQDEIAADKFTPSKISITISVTTFDGNALLFLIAPNIDILTESNDTPLFFAGYLKDGQIWIELNYGWMDPLILHTSQKYNTGRQIDFDVIKLYQNGTETLSLHLPLENFTATETRILKKKQILRTKKCQLFFGGVSERFRSLYSNFVINKLQINNGLLGVLDATIYGYHGIYNKEQFDFTGLDEYSGDFKFSTTVFDVKGLLKLKTNLTTTLDFVLRTDQKDAKIVRIGTEKATITLVNYHVKFKYIDPTFIKNPTPKITNPYLPRSSNYLSLRITKNSKNTVNSAGSEMVLSVNGIEVDRYVMNGSTDGLLEFGMNSLNGTIRDVRVDDILVEFSTESVFQFKNVKIGRGNVYIKNDMKIG